MTPCAGRASNLPAGGPRRVAPERRLHRRVRHNVPRLQVPAGRRSGRRGVAAALEPPGVRRPLRRSRLVAPHVRGSELHSRREHPGAADTPQRARAARQLRATRRAPRQRAASQPNLGLCRAATPLSSGGESPRVERRCRRPCDLRIGSRGRRGRARSRARCAKRIAHWREVFVLAPDCRRSCGAVGRGTRGARTGDASRSIPLRVASGRRGLRSRGNGAGRGDA